MENTEEAGILKIYAVVVTFNRLELLKRNVRCLRENRPVGRIVVVNNGSTDGTAQWLATQADERLTFITQDNVGGSGGFFTGISYAFGQGADWIWCMDDDVFPRPDCLEKMLPHARCADVGIIAPRRLMEGAVFTNDFQRYNLTNPFASMYAGKLKGREISEPVEIAGTAFEGPFIRREVVEKVGLPNKELFIFCDDTDYCLRTLLAGWKILYVPCALMDKHKFFTPRDSWAVRNRKKKWKRFYQVRNSAYLNHHYGRTWGVRYVRSFISLLGYLVPALLTAAFAQAWQWRDIPRLWQAYRDGIHEKLGKM